jgi:4-amino-4-deoxy-L-arabinose transferase-like glycosyltransferase
VGLRGKERLKSRSGKIDPLWAVIPLIFAALCASHCTLLRLPYYWDEAGYYIPAAWDFFRTGSLIPVSTLSNAHPPLPSVYLAIWWKIFGFHPLVTRIAVLAVAAVALGAVWRLAERLVGVRAVTLWTVALTAVYPIWFTQSSLAHADIFAAAGALWGLACVFPRLERFSNLRAPASLVKGGFFLRKTPLRVVLPGYSYRRTAISAELEQKSTCKPWTPALWFSLAVLSKETAILFPLALAVVDLAESFRAQPEERRQLWARAAWLAGCALPLAAWYGWHYLKTGFLFGNPEFLRYNAQANLDPARFLAAFVHRLLHLTAHMNLFIPVALALAALALKPRSDPDRHQRPAIGSGTLWRILILVLVNLFFFSILGGALLTRYLLPIYPLELLLAVFIFYSRVRLWQGMAAFSLVAFVVGLLINPWYGFAPEDNLSYARIVRQHQAGIAELNARYPGTTVLTAWPMSDELTKPELGYLKDPYKVEIVSNFASAEIARAAAEPEKYTAALVFSTKIDPASPPLSLGAKSREADERYFGLHHDLSPEAIARVLDGTLVWKQEEQGQWIGLISFRHMVEAQLQMQKTPLAALP